MPKNILISIALPVTDFASVDAAKATAKAAFPDATMSIDDTSLPRSPAEREQWKADEVAFAQTAKAHAAVNVQEAANQLAQAARNKQDVIDRAVDAARIDEQAKADQRVGESVDHMTEVGIAVAEAASQDATDKADRKSTRLN